MLLAFAGMSAQNPGETDNTFGNNGVLQFAISESFDQAHAILVQPDGKIITIGRARMDGFNYSLYVSRHLTDGQFDGTFGDGGVRVWRPSEAYGNFAMGAQLQEDGRILITGHSFDQVACAFVLRLNEDGSDDTSFGDNGLLVLSNGTIDAVEDIELQRDGKMVMAGYRTDEHDRMVVFRVTADGQLDNTFGTGGVQVLSLPNASESFVFDVEIQDDNKILLFGTRIIEGSAHHSVIVRLNEDGSYDTTFADNGIKYFSVGDGSNFLLSGCVRPDGRILVGGHYWIVNQPVLRYGLFVASLNADGTEDLTFGENNGLVQIEVDKTAANYMLDMELSDDDKLFCLGRVTNNIYSDFTILNFTMEGSLNPGFSDDGIVILDLDGGFDEPHCSALQPDGKLLVCGWSYPAGVYISSNVVVARYYTGVIQALEETESKCADFVCPNPTSGLLKLNLANDNIVYQAKVYDMTGRVVMSQQIAAQGALDVSNLRSGSYFIQLVSDKETLVNRFVKE